MSRYLTTAAGLLAVLGTLATLALAAAALSTTGCGYALVGRGSNIPEDIQTVYIAPFVNRTQRQQVEQFVTEAVANELVRRRRFNLVSDRSTADAELAGVVLNFGLTPITFDNQGRATEYEISLTAQVVFQRLADEAILWQNERYQFRENYAIDLTEVGFDREDPALREAAERFAETMLSDLLEGF